MKTQKEMFLDLMDYIGAEINLKHDEGNITDQGAKELFDLIRYLKKNFSIYFAGGENESKDISKD